MIHTPDNKRGSCRENVVHGSEIVLENRKLTHATLNCNLVDLKAINI